MEFKFLISYEMAEYLFVVLRLIKFVFLIKWNTELTEINILINLKSTYLNCLNGF